MIELIGIVAFPISFLLLRWLPDRGIALSIPLGMVIAAYLSWVLSYTHIVPADGFGPALSLIIIAIPSIYIFCRHRKQIVQHLQSHIWLIVVTQLIFLALFSLWTLYRFYDPSISHTEQPMDMALLSASVRTEFAPPEDPWLRGESISYYYFGYWIIAFCSNLVNIKPSIAYNLALSLIPAITSIGVIGLVYNIIKIDGGKIKFAIFAGLISSMVLLASSNFEGVLEFLRFNGIGSESFWDWLSIDGITGPIVNLTDSWRPTEFWWWWRATRVINTFENGVGLDYTIHEFPLFSTLLGDLHPHFLSLPFVMLFLGLVTNFALSQRIMLPGLTLISNLPIKKVIVNYATAFRNNGSQLIFIGFILGALGFINTWDLPIFGLVFVGVVFFKIYKDHGLSILDILIRALPILVIVFAATFLLYSPYYFYFQSQFSGLSPVTDITSRPIHFFVVWGLFLLLVIPFVLYVFSKSQLRHGWFGIACISALISILPFVFWLVLIAWTGSSKVMVLSRFVKLLPIMIVIFMAAYSAMYALRDGRIGGVKTAGLSLILVLVCSGFTLIMLPELIIVSDQFGSRMNTIFKLYYQAWILLSISLGVVAYYVGYLLIKSDGLQKLIVASSVLISVVLLSISLYYAPAAAFTKMDTAEVKSLDGLEYIKNKNPDELAAINFLINTSEKHEALVEAVGTSYSEYGRISASTGIPTILGWPAHEIQWRGSDLGLSQRADDVERIYQGLDPQEAYSLLVKYDVSYVYVGPRERRKYGTSGLEKFEGLMTKVFDTDTVVIYKIR
tara:strand:- start:19521 stop:21881 length:2361 start_codon:yes stop_codon:yes gene_type:complete